MLYYLNEFFCDHVITFSVLPISLLQLSSLPSIFFNQLSVLHTISNYSKHSGLKNNKHLICHTCCGSIFLAQLSQVPVVQSLVRLQSNLQLWLWLYLKVFTEGRMYFPISLMQLLSGFGCLSTAGPKDSVLCWLSARGLPQFCHIYLSIRQLTRQQQAFFRESKQKKENSQMEATLCLYLIFKLTLLPYCTKRKSLGPAHIQGGKYQKVRIIGGHFRGGLPHHASMEFCLFCSPLYPKSLQCYLENNIFPYLFVE